MLKRLWFEWVFYWLNKKPDNELTYLDALRLVWLFPDEYLIHYSIKEGLRLKILTHFISMEDYLMELDNAILVMQDLDVLSKKRSSLTRNIALDDYLTDNKGYPLEITQQVKDFKRKYLQFTNALNTTVGSEGFNYYCRHYNHLKMEACYLIKLLTQLKR